jgi:hypothetical protein
VDGGGANPAGGGGANPAGGVGAKELCCGAK